MEVDAVEGPVVFVGRKDVLQEKSLGLQKYHFS